MNRANISQYNWLIMQKKKTRCSHLLITFHNVLRWIEFSNCIQIMGHLTWSPDPTWPPSPDHGPLTPRTMDSLTHPWNMNNLTPWSNSPRPWTTWPLKSWTTWPHPWATWADYPTLWPPNPDLTQPPKHGRTDLITPASGIGMRAKVGIASQWTTLDFFPRMVLIFVDITIGSGF